MTPPEGTTQQQQTAERGSTEQQPSVPGVTGVTGATFGDPGMGRVAPQNLQGARVMLASGSLPGDDIPSIMGVSEEAESQQAERGSTEQQPLIPSIPGSISHPGFRRVEMGDMQGAGFVQSPASLLGYNIPPASSQQARNVPSASEKRQEADMPSSLAERQEVDVWSAGENVPQRKSSPEDVVSYSKETVQTENVIEVEGHMESISTKSEDVFGYKGNKEVYHKKHMEFTQTSVDESEIKTVASIKAEAKPKTNIIEIPVKHVHSDSLQEPPLIASPEICMNDSIVAFASPSGQCQVFHSHFWLVECIQFY